MQRKSLVAANWKMNGTLTSIASLLNRIIHGLNNSPNADVAICPPYVYLAECQKRLKGTGIALGAQNISQEEKGPYTGEIAADMLKDFDCDYVIVGHSERRTLYSETGYCVARKLAQAVSAGLKPILCVGELLQERESGKTESVISKQLSAILEFTGIDDFSNTIIAYEPVWAIGTGKTANPQQAEEVHAFIRQYLFERDNEIAEKIRIIYGGSVKAENAKELYSMADIDGGLIGGASLQPDDFIKICHAMR